MSRTTFMQWVGIGAVGLTCFAIPANAQESAPLASQLTELLGGRQLDAFAAKDTLDEDRFVAVLAYPSQLLVVSARYEAPVLIHQKIASEQYRDVYIDLNTASIADTKVLVTDSGADGMAVGGPGAGNFAIDLLDDGSGVLLMDGKQSGGTLSNDDYTQAAMSAEKQYSRMLSALIAQLQ